RRRPQGGDVRHRGGDRRRRTARGRRGTLQGPLPRRRHPLGVRRGGAGSLPPPSGPGRAGARGLDRRDRRGHRRSACRDRGQLAAQAGPRQRREALMRAVVAYVLRHRPIAFALLVAFVVAAAAAFQRLPIEAYPDVTNIQVQVITLWPGHAAEEVERFVTIPVENALNGLPQRVALRSISEFGLSVVTIVFEDDADNFKARNRVGQEVAGIEFPEGAQP